LIFPQGQLAFPLAALARYGVAVLSVPASVLAFYGGAPADVSSATVVPLVPPTRLRALAVAAESVTLGWNMASSGGAGALAAALLDYRVVYEHVPSAIVFSIDVPAGATAAGIGGGGVFTVTGLRNAEPYRFTVQVLLLSLSIQSATSLSITATVWDYISFPLS
jgi:hypothetical protein